MNYPSDCSAQTFVRLFPFGSKSQDFEPCPLNVVFFKFISREEKKNYSRIIRIHKQRPLHFARMRGFSKTGEFCPF